MGKRRRLALPIAKQPGAGARRHARAARGFLGEAAETAQPWPIRQEVGAAADHRQGAAVTRETAALRNSYTEHLEWEAVKVSVFT